MITVEMYGSLIIIAAVLFLYTFWDLRNRIYGNIVAGFFCSLLCFVLALFSANGMVVIPDQQIAQTAESTALNITTTTYTYADPTMIQSTTLLYMFGLVGSIMALFVAYLLVEAYYEYRVIPAYVGEKEYAED